MQANGESVFQMLALIFLTQQKLRWTSSVHLWSVLSLIKDKNLIKYRIMKSTEIQDLRIKYKYPFGINK